MAQMEWTTNTQDTQLQELKDLIKFDMGQI